jgi:hypothetical protein
MKIVIILLLYLSINKIIYNFALSKIDLSTELGTKSPFFVSLRRQKKEK